MHVMPSFTHILHTSQAYITHSHTIIYTFVHCTMHMQYIFICMHTHLLLTNICILTFIQISFQTHTHQLRVSLGHTGCIGASSWCCAQMSLITVPVFEPRFNACRQVLSLPMLPLQVLIWALLGHQRVRVLASQNSWGLLREQNDE